ncbi:MAG: endonuclease/exonuclease/phosphatase family protein [Gemmataceae bacterium]
MIVSYNIAKAFAHRDGLEFEHPDKVTQRLQQLAQVIIMTQPDIVCLSEVMTEAGTMPIDQLEFLAKATRLPHVAFGENYNFGIPGYRIVGGNAILSRTPLKPVANISLAGRQPFFVTRNNRRALFAETELHGQTVLVGSLHNDSFNPANNEAQIKQIVDFIGDRPCILAGDFNAKPGSPTMKYIDDCKHFSGEINGNGTFPASAPTQRIDYVFAPPTWLYGGTQVLANAASDHRPVISVFTVPEK